MTLPSATPEPQAFWYVQAAGQVWGPYPQARLADFVHEGRLTGESLVGSHSGGPFGPAERRRELQALFAPAHRAALAEPWPESALAAPEPLQDAASSQLQPRAMLVWADLASLTPGRFEAVVAAYGAYAAIHPGLWLVQARMGPAALRNALSRRLRSDDALLVVEAPLDRSAWFNLKPFAERELRQLWGGQG